MQDDPGREPENDNAGMTKSLSRLPDGDSQENSDSLELPGDRYRIIGEIARDRMWVVLRARDTDIRRPFGRTIVGAH
ncbi:MAG: hypothetical protein ABGX22_23125 [Pirellulaceae bacterium]|nr:hypothetical protein [Planctomycetaceae bacterium]